MKPAEFLRDYLSKWGPEMEPEEYDQFWRCVAALESSAVVRQTVIEGGRRLKFRLDLTIDDAGQLAAANLVVRDGETRQSRSLGGWPVPTEGADIERLLEAIRREVEIVKAG